MIGSFLIDAAVLYINKTQGGEIKTDYLYLLFYRLCADFLIKIHLPATEEEF